MPTPGDPAPYPAELNGTTAVESRLAVILSGLRFPAHRWEIVIQAETYGADRTAQAWLARLPAGRYPSLAALAAVIAGVAAPPRPEPPTAHAGIAYRMWRTGSGLGRTTRRSGGGVRVMAVVSGSPVGLAYSFVFLYEATEHRACKAGWPPPRHRSTCPRGEPRRAKKSVMSIAPATADLRGPIRLPT